MSRIQPFHQSLKVFNITYPATIREESYNSIGVALPSTEPATGQILYTLHASDFFTISGVTDINSVCSQLLVTLVSGLNNSGSTQSVNYRVLKNGVSLYTGSRSNIANAQYYTLSPNFTDNFIVGDVVEVRLWCASSAVTLNYGAYYMGITRFTGGLKAGTLITNLTVASVAASPSLPTLGLSPTNGTNYYYLDPGYNGTAGYSYVPSSNGNTLFGYKIACVPSTGIIRQMYGDFSNSYSTSSVSTTAMPYNGYCPQKITQVSYRVTNIIL